MLTGLELPKIEQKKGETNSKLMERKKAFVANGISTFVPFFVKEAKGSVLEDADGNIYLDLYSGIGVVNAGHRPDSVVEGIKNQADKLLHTCFMVAPYENYLDLAEKIIDIIPIKGEKKVAFFNSGAEAVENAIKIAKAYTKRSGVISFSNAFHGRTLMTMSLTSKTKPYKYEFGPFAPEVYKVPSAYCYRCPFGKEYGKCSFECLDYIEQFFVSEVDPSTIAAMIIEPVQGEGGFIVQPEEFMQGLEKICKKYGIIFIVDEIQTGFARTGRMFASEYYGIDPDIITLAKSIASGLPLSAVVGKKDIMDAPGPGRIGGTYGGNPLACASALATIDFMKENNLEKKSEKIGKYMMERLSKLKEKYDFVGDVRGLGSMAAIEFIDKDKKPNKSIVSKIIQKCLDEGLVIIAAGVFGNVIRFLPPLVVTDEQLKKAMDIFEKAFENIK